MKLYMVLRNPRCNLAWQQYEVFHWLTEKELEKSMPSVAQYGGLEEVAPAPLNIDGSRR